MREIINSIRLLNESLTDMPPDVMKALSTLARNCDNCAEFRDIIKADKSAGSYQPGNVEDAIMLRQDSGSLAGYSKEAISEWFGRYDSGPRYRSPVPKGNKVSIYRATPTGRGIWPGDYVTESRLYAADHIKSNLDGIGKIFTMDVTLDDLFPADGPHEFWYAPAYLGRFSSLEDLFMFVKNTSE